MFRFFQIRFKTLIRQTWNVLNYAVSRITKRKTIKNCFFFEVHCDLIDLFRDYFKHFENDYVLGLEKETEKSKIVNYNTLEDV